jgi:membrane-associated phospholipid phosphatase
MKRLVITTVSLVLALALTAATALGQSARHGSLSSIRAARESGQPVLDWNQDLLSIVNTPGAQPANLQPTWSFAMLHAAIYDAVNSIDRSHDPYAISVRAPRGASETAAADAAAHAVLAALYPAQMGTVDAEYALELSQVPDAPAKQEGVRLGQMVARGLLAIREGDGSNVAPPPFVPGTDPGNYRPTPPNLPAPVFSTWGSVTPFVLDSGDQFRPAPPPALTSPDYASAVNEVQILGSATSTTRTAEQTVIGKFWAPPIQNFWNQIAQTVASANHADLPTAARLFATLNLSIADSTIGLYDAKYTYQLWRPVTAIRLADTDGNPQTIADPSWLPLAGNTPADPSYPGAHSTISAAAAEVLASFYGDHQRFSITSPAFSSVTRSFTTFSAAAREAGLSRIYAGVHTRLDHQAGQRLGREVAHFVLDNALQPVPSFSAE